MNDSGFREYFSSMQNSIDFSMFFINSYYCMFRINNTDNILPEHLLELENETPPKPLGVSLNEVGILSVMCCFLIYICAVKLMFLNRIAESHGVLILLIEQIFHDAAAFSCLFFGWVIVFSMMFRIIGVNNTNLSDNNLTLNDFGAYFVQVFLNGTGNGNGPTYLFWVEEMKINSDSIIPRIMVGMGWTLWILNSFFINVILMNFLIAIVF